MSANDKYAGLWAMPVDADGYGKLPPDLTWQFKVSAAYEIDGTTWIVLDLPSEARHYRADECRFFPDKRVKT